MAEKLPNFEYLPDAIKPPVERGRVRFLLIKRILLGATVAAIALPIASAALVGATLDIAYAAAIGGISGALWPVDRLLSS